VGALLGMIGKNPLARLKQSADAGDNCRLCLADCHRRHSGEKLDVRLSADLQRAPRQQQQ
jgi:hypothetical protein